MAQLNPLQPDESALPPEEVRFLDLHVEPWPDGRRIRVQVTLPSFQQPPNLDLTVFNAQGKRVSHVMIIENTEEQFAINMHLSTNESQGEYQLKALLHYPDKENIAQSSCFFQLPPPAPNSPE